MATPQESKVLPRYQLTEKAYIDDVLHDPETRPIDPETEERKPLIIAYSGTPGPHMKPVNKEAHDMVKQHPIVMRDPIAALTILAAPVTA